MQIATAWEQGKHVLVEVINDDADDNEGEVVKEDTDNLVNDDTSSAIGNDDAAYGGVDDGEVFKENTDNLVNDDTNNAIVKDNAVEDDADNDNENDQIKVSRTILSTKRSVIQL